MFRHFKNYASSVGQFNFRRIENLNDKTAVALGRQSFKCFFDYLSVIQKVTGKKQSAVARRLANGKISFGFLILKIFGKTLKRSLRSSFAWTAQASDFFAAMSEKEAKSER